MIRKQSKIQFLYIIINTFIHSFIFSCLIFIIFRPCLTWHDIQSLLVYTAVPIDLQDVDWTTNGAGLRHSHQHGFGVLDAYRLTMAARVNN